MKGNRKPKNRIVVCCIAAVLMIGAMMTTVLAKESMNTGTDFIAIQEGKPEENEVDSKEPARLKSIEVTTKPTKTDYAEGEKFDPSGMVVTAKYWDESHKVVTGYRWSPDGELDLNGIDIAITTVEIIYEENGVTVTTKVGIVIRQYCSLYGHDWGPWEVLEPATCDKWGKEIHICQNDTSHKGTSALQPLGHDGGEWTQTKAPTTEEEGEERRICNRDVNHVETRTIEKLGDQQDNEGTESILDRIEINGPTNNRYTVGDTFDQRDLKVTAKYTNGGADKALGAGEYELSKPDMSTAGTKTVTVTYEEGGVTKTAEFEIIVEAKQPEPPEDTPVDTGNENDSSMQNDNSQQVSKGDSIGELPKTGDETSINISILIVSAASISVGAILFHVFKNRKTANSRE